MYNDKFPSEPTDYFDIDDEGNVLPPKQSEDTLKDIHYENIEDEIKGAVERQVGQLAVNTGGRPSGMSDDEYFKKIREEREDDRRGTHPGTSRELSSEEKVIAKKAEKERREAEKKQKKINDAIRVINTINPSTIDASLARELRQAREFLRKNGIDPKDHLPDFWKNN